MAWASTGRSPFHTSQRRRSGHRATSARRQQVGAGLPSRMLEIGWRRAQRRLLLSPRSTPSNPPTWAGNWRVRGPRPLQWPSAAQEWTGSPYRCRRQFRHCAVHLDALHGPGSGCCPARAPSRPTPRRHPALRRARPRARPWRPALAATAGAAAEEGGRWLPPHPSQRRAVDRLSLAAPHAGGRRRAGGAHVPRRRFERHRHTSLSCTPGYSWPAAGARAAMASRSRAGPVGC